MSLTFTRAYAEFMSYLSESGRHLRTIAAAGYSIRCFGEWLASATDLKDMRAVRREHILAYADYVRTRPHRRTGQPLGPRYRLSLLRVVRLFFTSLLEHRRILAHPMHRLRLLDTIPEGTKLSLTEEEAANFLDSIHDDSRLGLRDRVLFELIYSSGLRAGEAARLLVGDYNRTTRLLRVTQAKFSKDRVVPVTATASRLLDRYCNHRPSWQRIFRSASGGDLSSVAINKRFKLRIAETGFDRRGLSVHSLRHACATHLIGRGADLRYVQELLGHDSVQSTVHYTKEQPDNLRRVYLKYHPREHDLLRHVDDGYRARLATIIEPLKKVVRKKLARGKKRQ